VSSTVSRTVGKRHRDGSPDGRCALSIQSGEKTREHASWRKNCRTVLRGRGKPNSKKNEAASFLRACCRPRRLRSHEGGGASLSRWPKNVSVCWLLTVSVVVSGNGGGSITGLYLLKGRREAGNSVADVTAEATILPGRKKIHRTTPSLRRAIQSKLRGKN